MPGKLKQSEITQAELMVAAYKGHLEVVKVLLANGANKSTTDDNGLDGAKKSEKDVTDKMMTTLGFSIEMADQYGGIKGK